MKSYSIVEAKTRLSELVREALKGKKVVIGKRSKPLVQITVYQPVERKIGLFDGQGWMAPDFNAPLEEFQEYE